MISQEEAGEKKRRPFRKRKSDYGLRLEEKQKLKFIYDVKEKQLRRYVETALKSKGNPAESLLITLETRLDNVVYRLGFVPTRQSARQMVSHGHVMVDGEKVNVPSYSVKTGQEISIKEKMLRNVLVQESLENKKKQDLPSWLSRENNKGRAMASPSKEDLRKDVDMSQVMELYT